MKEADRRGGARLNAGRKKIPPDECKIQLAFYVKKKNVDKIRAHLERIIKKLDI